MPRLRAATQLLSVQPLVVFSPVMQNIWERGTSINSCIPSLYWCWQTCDGPNTAPQNTLAFFQAMCALLTNNRTRSWPVLLCVTIIRFVGLQRVSLPSLWYSLPIDLTGTYCFYFYPTLHEFRVLWKEAKFAVNGKKRELLIAKGSWIWGSHILIHWVVLYYDVLIHGGTFSHVGQLEDVTCSLLVWHFREEHFFPPFVQ